MRAWTPIQAGPPAGPIRSRGRGGVDGRPPAAGPRADLIGLEPFAAARRAPAGRPTLPPCPMPAASSPGPAGPAARAASARGIACIMAGIFCLTISDSLAKWLGGHYPPIQILFLRSVIALPVVAAAALALGGRRALRTRHLPVHLLRGAINVASAWCFYLGLTLLPLAETTAIAFAAPLCVVGLSAIALGERVSPGRWAAVLAGFAGVLVVVRPGTAGFQPAALLPLATAVGYALMMVSARRIGPEEGMLTTMLYIAAGQAVFSAAPQLWYWRPLEPALLPGFLGVAVFSTLGLGLITQAFRIAPASVVAPFDYSGMLWATLFGWLFWREMPDPVAWLGIAMIVASGLYVALGETRRDKPARR